MDKTEQDKLKRLAAQEAVKLVQPGMIVGLGYGSTALWAIREIGEALASGALHDIVGVPCAEGSAALARELNIPLVSLDEIAQIDLTIDGADEVDPQLNLIKGGGGALLREKMVAQASKREAIIVDASKLSPALGTTFAVPVEVVAFGLGATKRFLEGLGASVSLRMTAMGESFKTDQGNQILDCTFGPIADPAALAVALEGRAGIVEHGLFLGLATDLFVADANGVRHANAKGAA